MRGTSVSHALPRILAAAGLQPIAPHVLRHAAATLMLADGHSMRVISEQLGHRNPALTARIYAHVVPEAQRAAVTIAERASTPQGLVSYKCKPQLRGYWVEGPRKKGLHPLDAKPYYGATGEAPIDPLLGFDRESRLGERRPCANGSPFLVPTLVEQSRDFLHRPDVIRHASRHRGRGLLAKRGMTACW
jgi:hypothetical protein